MACLVESFLGQRFEKTANAIRDALLLDGGILSIVSLSCSTALEVSLPFNSTKYWSPYSTLCNKKSHFRPSCSLNTQPSTLMARYWAAVGFSNVILERFSSKTIWEWLLAVTHFSGNVVIIERWDLRSLMRLCRKQRPNRFVRWGGVRDL